MQPMPPPQLLEELTRHGQDHLLAGWDTLNNSDRHNLVESLSRFNFLELKSLYAKRFEPVKLPDLSTAEAPPLQIDQPDVALEALGSVALQRARVAVVLVAGGQGSRLGSDLPKGCYPITVSYTHLTLPTICSV